MLPKLYWWIEFLIDINFVFICVWVFILMSLNQLQTVYMYQVPIISNVLFFLHGVWKLHNNVSMQLPIQKSLQNIQPHYNNILY